MRLRASLLLAAAFWISTLHHRDFCPFPMHYRSEGIGFDVLSTIEPFVAGLENVEYENEEYLLTFAAPEQQIVVLKPAAASNK